MENSTAKRKYKIVQLYKMGMSADQIYERTDMTFDYVMKVIDEYVTEGTITVNSRLNKLKL